MNGTKTLQDVIKIASNQVATESFRLKRFNSRAGKSVKAGYAIGDLLSPIPGTGVASAIVVSKTMQYFLPVFEKKVFSEHTGARDDIPEWVKKVKGKSKKKSEKEKDSKDEKPQETKEMGQIKKQASNKRSTTEKLKKSGLYDANAAKSKLFFSQPAGLTVAALAAGWTSNIGGVTGIAVIQKYRSSVEGDISKAEEVEPEIKAEGNADLNTVPQELSSESADPSNEPSGDIALDIATHVIETFGLEDMSELEAGAIGYTVGAIGGILAGFVIGGFLSGMMSSLFGLSEKKYAHSVRADAINRNNTEEVELLTNILKSSDKPTDMYDLYGKFKSELKDGSELSITDFTKFIKIVGTSEKEAKKMGVDLVDGVPEGVRNDCKSLLQNYHATKHKDRMDFLTKMIKDDSGQQANIKIPDIMVKCSLAFEAMTPKEKTIAHSFFGNDLDEINLHKIEKTLRHSGIKQGPLHSAVNNFAKDIKEIHDKFHDKVDLNAVIPDMRSDLEMFKKELVKSWINDKSYDKGVLGQSSTNTDKMVIYDLNKALLELKQVVTNKSDQRELSKCEEDLSVARMASVKTPAKSIVERIFSVATNKGDVKNSTIATIVKLSEANKITRSPAIQQAYKPIQFPKWDNFEKKGFIGVITAIGKFVFDFLKYIVNKVVNLFRSNHFEQFKKGYNEERQKKNDYIDSKTFSKNLMKNLMNTYKDEKGMESSKTPLQMVSNPNIADCGPIKSPHTPRPPQVSEAKR